MYFSISLMQITENWDAALVDVSSWNWTRDGQDEKTDESEGHHSDAASTKISSTKIKAG